MSNLKQQLVSGVAYTAIAKYSGIIISLIVMAILARLLPPEDFGIMAIASVIINFYSIFTNIGFSAAIIQYKELSSDDLSNIHAFTLWLGLLLSAIFFVSSWLIAAFYHNSVLISLCQLLSVSLFFSAAAIVPNNLFYRDKDFRFIAWRTFWIQITCGIVSIAAALWGMGIYTLTLQPILSSLLIYVVSMHRYPQSFRWTFGIDSIRKIWNYSLYQFLFYIVNYFTRNFDKLLIGDVLGMKQLGFYEKSYRLMMLPIQNITFVLTPVMHPVLSDLQNDKQQLGVAHERIINLLSLVGFPLSAFLYFCAPELVLIFFGNQWEASIPIFRIFTLTVGVQLILSSSGSFFQAAGDTRHMFWCGLFSMFVTIICLLFGLYYFKTIEATAWCLVASFYISFFQNYIVMYSTIFHRKISMFFIQIISSIILTAIIAIINYLVSIITIDFSLISSLIIKSIITLTITICFIYFTNDTLWKELKRLAKIR